MSVKPWRGAIKEPTSYYKDPLNQSKAPPVSTQLEYVYGYRANGCKNNVKYLKSGQVIYFAAGVAIIQDNSQIIPIQKFFDNHNDDITAIDMHPDGVKVATGEIGPKPAIYVWDTNTMQVLCTFKNVLSKGVGALKFSPSGEKLVACGIDVNHEIAVFDTLAKSKMGGILICKVNGGKEQITELAWRTETEFASAGIKHFRVWTLNNNTVKSQSGIWGKQPNANNILLTVVASPQGDDYVCGAIDGSLQIFKNNVLS